MGCAFSDEEGVQPFLCYFTLIDPCFAAAGDSRKQVLQLLPKKSKL
jgi:hypothetical protein